MRVASMGHALFALTLIAIGVLGLVQGTFAPIWDGVPKTLPAREELAYLCAFVSLACGIGLLWHRTMTAAARVLFAWLALWMVLVKGHAIVLAPTVEGSYQSCGETAVIVAGAWVLYAWFAAGRDRSRLDFAAGDMGVRLARALYALALIAFGFSHFAYLDLTAPLVPGWLPAHVFWAHFTGCTHIAAGVGILLGVSARLAATLALVQIFLITALVWIPIVLSGHASAFHWSEFVVSWAITTGAWVVADSYRGVFWLALHRRWPRRSAP